MSTRQISNKVVYTGLAHKDENILLIAWRGFYEFSASKLIKYLACHRHMEMKLSCHSLPIPGVSILSPGRALMSCFMYTYFKIYPPGLCSAPTTRPQASS